jgi:hypothetical protein
MFVIVFRRWSDHKYLLAMKLDLDPSTRDREIWKFQDKNGDFDCGNPASSPSFNSNREAAQFLHKFHDAKKISKHLRCRMDIPQAWLLVYKVKSK